MVIDIYEVWVRCPWCGGEQKTKSLKRKQCVYCGKPFAIFVKGKPSRVAKVEGSYEEYMRDVRKILVGK